MSTKDRVRKDIDDSIKGVGEFIESTKRSLQKELAKTTPKIEHALDRSMDDAGQALSSALKTIDRASSHEQLELLKGYRTFLQGQAAFVDKKIKAMNG
jgi:hypothetical protein